MKNKDPKVVVVRTPMELANVWGPPGTIIEIDDSVPLDPKDYKYECLTIDQVMERLAAYLPKKPPSDK